MGSTSGAKCQALPQPKLLRKVCKCSANVIYKVDIKLNAQSHKPNWMLFQKQKKKKT